jgi:hypothetical protein
MAYAIVWILNAPLPTTTKAHVLKAWFPKWWYWEVVEPLRGGTAGWRCAQVIEHLPGKHKALSSNPSTAKKKKKEVGPNGRSLGNWGMALRIWGPWPPSSLFVPCSWVKQFCPTMCSLHDMLLTITPKQWGNWSWTGSTKTINQNELFSLFFLYFLYYFIFSLLIDHFRHFVIVVESWLTQYKNYMLRTIFNQRWARSIHWKLWSTAEKN